MLRLLSDKAWRLAVVLLTLHLLLRLVERIAIGECGRAGRRSRLPNSPLESAVARRDAGTRARDVLLHIDGRLGEGEVVVETRQPRQLQHRQLRRVKQRPTARSAPVGQASR
jgi:hypothetical protein